MQDCKNDARCVAQEIETLKVLLIGGFPGAPLVVAYLQAALRALEAANDGEGINDLNGLVTQVSDNLAKTGHDRKTSGGMDSLGGGRLP